MMKYTTGLLLLITWISGEQVAWSLQLPITSRARMLRPHRTSGRNEKAAVTSSIIRQTRPLSVPTSMNASSSSTMTFQENQGDDSISVKDRLTSKYILQAAEYDVGKHYISATIVGILFV